MGPLPLLFLLVVGVLIHFLVSPGTYTTDDPEVMLPLGIVGGLIVFVYLIRRHDDSSCLNKRFGLFGWLGALVAGSAGGWLAIHQLHIGSTFVHFYDNTLTMLSIGIAVGALVGTVTAPVLRSPSPHETDREAVVAESTWTNHTGLDPILVELVEQLSDLEDVDLVEIEPLATFIDMEVFRALRAMGESPWQVRFYASGYEVRVNSHGTISISDTQKQEEGPAAGTIHSSSDRSDVASSSNGSQERSPLSAEPVSPAEAVYETIAEYEHVEPADLPSLDDWVHPETLDALTGSWQQLDRSLEFSYVWYHVTVHPTGEVSLRVR